MAFESNTEAGKKLRNKTIRLDPVDCRLIVALAGNARISLAELGRSLELSAPTISERIRRLEENGVIRSYAAEVDYAAIGRPVSAWLRIRPVPGRLHKVAEILRQMPEIVECDRITGEDCFLARAQVASVDDLESLIDKVIPYSMTNTSIVQSTPVRRRLPPLRPV